VVNIKKGNITMKFIARKSVFMVLCIIGLSVFVVNADIVALWDFDDFGRD
jgi:hypothetical protein